MVVAQLRMGSEKLVHADQANYLINKKTLKSILGGKYKTGGYQDQDQVADISE